MLNLKYVACPLPLRASSQALKCGQVLGHVPWERASGEALGIAVGEEGTASLDWEALSDFA